MLYFYPHDVEDLFLLDNGEGCKWLAINDGDIGYYVCYLQLLVIGYKGSDCFVEFCLLVES